VCGGHGGNGSMSFMKLFANEWAGPDGGDGGHGGHVIFQGKLLLFLRQCVFGTVLPDQSKTKSRIFATLRGMSEKAQQHFASLIVFVPLISCPWEDGYWQQSVGECSTQNDKDEK